MTSNEPTGAPPRLQSDAAEPPKTQAATGASEAPSTASESDARSPEQTSDRPLSGGPLIFASDASAEGAGLTGALRGRGYVVVDVPLGLLVRRVAVQRPALILCDVDAAGALEATSQLRGLPGGNRVDVLF